MLLESVDWLCNQTIWIAIYCDTFTVTSETFHAFVGYRHTFSEGLLAVDSKLMIKLENLAIITPYLLLTLKASLSQMRLYFELDD